MSEIERAQFWPSSWRSSGALIGGVLLLADVAMVTHSRVIRDLAVAAGLAIGVLFIVFDVMRLRDRRWKQELFVGTWAWLAVTTGWLVVPYVANGANLAEQAAMLSSHKVPPGSWLGHAWALPVPFAGGQANLYAYANDDPVNLSDSSGLWTFGVFAAAGGGPGWVR